MNKILAVLVTLTLIGTPVLAATTNFFTGVTGKGIINIGNFGKSDVNFLNDVKIAKGTLNFNQKITTPYGDFRNSVRMNGKNLKFNNVAGESSVPGRWSGTGEGWVPQHREVTFAQNLYAGESSTNWDEVKSFQSFSYNGKYIAQKVQVNPTHNVGHEVEPDKLVATQEGKMNSMFLPPTCCQGRAFLHQKGKMHADYDFASQWTNLNGGASSTIVSWNNKNWVHFDQAIMVTQ